MTEPGVERGTWAADRQLGWLMSLCGVVLIAGRTVGAMTAWDAFATVWNFGGVLVLLIIGGLAVGGRVLPMPLLRAGWMTAPILGAVLFATSFAAYRGPDATAALPWIWTVEPVLVSYLVLWLRPLPAVLFALLSASLPAVSGLIVLGSAPATVSVITPAHLSNLGLVAIFLGVRGQLIRLRTDEARAEQRELERERTAADARRRETLARLVHDELLSVFTAAMAFSGSAPDPLRAEARAALGLLSRAASTGTDEEHQRGTREALAELVAVVRSIDPDCPVQTDLRPGSVPADVVEALGRAAAEALRNSVRHAGPDAARGVELLVHPGRLRVVVRDDGRGFDPDGVHPARIGVRGSVLGRMRALDGGRAELRTAPGSGTEVVLEWAT